MASYTSMVPFARAGKLRMPSITNPVRMASAPDVPTIADAVPGYSSRGWFVDKYARLVKTIGFKPM